jgi:Asp-tRNA(Asn)/Glu-tRNA(Gln) amidotransferase C subunit
MNAHPKQDESVPDALSVTAPVSPAQVRAMAEAAQLALPPDRIDALSHSFSDFLTGFAKIRALDTGDREPATLTHREEDAT